MSGRFSIVGAGNLAWHLAPALENVGYQAVGVFSRQAAKAADLVERLYQAEVKENLNFIPDQLDFLFLTVPDDQIFQLVQSLELPKNTVIVHCSGSQSINTLDNEMTNRTGVFYPLQTFTRGKRVQFDSIPLFVEGSSTEVAMLLLKMGAKLNCDVFELDSKKRFLLHLSAVITNNLTNHLQSISEDILTEIGLDFSVMGPLLQESLEKVLTIGPAKAQTGPAQRADLRILDRHHDYLKSENEATADIYRLISQSILDRYHTNK